MPCRGQPFHMAHTLPAYRLHVDGVFSSGRAAGGPGTVSAIDGHRRLPASLTRGDQVMALVRVIEKLTSPGSVERAVIRFHPAAVVISDFGKIPGRP